MLRRACLTQPVNAVIAGMDLWARPRVHFFSKSRDGIELDSVVT